MLRRALATALTVCLAAAPAHAVEVDTAAAYAHMIDFNTGQVLLAKQSDTLMHPSSMSKLMTVYILYQRIKQGRVKLTDQFLVSEKAWKTQGSKMFVHVGDKVAVEDLIRGIVIQSGNDACIVVAEGLAGSEAAFAEEMNRVGKEIGLTQSHFVNSTGWPDDQHLMSARDLATLARRIITDFPDFYHYDAEKSFTYSGITQANRNRLLGNDIGVDGLKTGHTDIGGYGITLSAKEPASGRRLILVVNGLESDNARMEEGDKLLRWGFREFDNRTIARPNQPVAEANVWFGDKLTVPVAPATETLITLPHTGMAETTFTLVYNTPLQAPVVAGMQVAELIVTPPGMEKIAVPLVATENVERLGGLKKIIATAKYYLLGHP